jgi:hypothetical protein
MKAAYIFQRGSLLFAQVKDLALKIVIYPLYKMKPMMSRLAAGSRIYCISASDKAAPKRMPLITQSARSKMLTCINGSYSTSRTKNTPFSASDLFDLKERAEEDKFFNKLDAQEIEAFKEKARAEVEAILSGKLI